MVSIVALLPFVTHCGTTVSQPADAFVTSDTPISNDTPSFDASTVFDATESTDTVFADTFSTDTPESSTDTFSTDTTSTVADASDVSVITTNDHPDTGSLCPAGVTDRCPSATPGPCPDLSDGLRHIVTPGSLTADLTASCEGGSTARGGDGVLPLSLTAPSDVVITAIPTGGDAVVVAITPAALCGHASAELRCANSSVSGHDDLARLELQSLSPGTYFVSVSTARGNPVFIDAQVTTARPRIRGDMCPGLAIVPDGPPVSLATDSFLSTADHGTSCGSNNSPRGWVDAVFSYTLTQPRDVTVVVSGTGSSELFVEVASHCGQRASTVSQCVSNNPARLQFYRQPPGTYYITVDHRASTGPGRTLVAMVTTAAPSPASPADNCPGVLLPPSTAIATPVSGISPGSATFACAASHLSDAVFDFVAPPLGDVLMNVRANEDVAFQLSAHCGGPTIAACVGPASNVWRRLRGLTPGQTYCLTAGTTATSGSLTTQWLPVTASTTTRVSGNDSCSRAHIIPETGGVFTGDSSTAAINLFPPCGGLLCASGRVAYFRLTLTTRRRVIASTYGSNFDTLLAVVPASRCPGHPVDDGCNDNTIAQSSLLDLTLDPGTYAIAVQGCGFRVGGSYTLDIATLAP